MSDPQPLYETFECSSTAPKYKLQPALFKDYVPDSWPFNGNGFSPIMPKSLTDQPLLDNYEFSTEIPKFVLDPILYKGNGFSTIYPKSKSDDPFYRANKNFSSSEQKTESDPSTSRAIPSPEQKTVSDPFMSRAIPSPEQKTVSDPFMSRANESLLSPVQQTMSADHSLIQANRVYLFQVQQDDDSGYFTAFSYKYLPYCLHCGDQFALYGSATRCTVYYCMNPKCLYYDQAATVERGRWYYLQIPDHVETRAEIVFKDCAFYHSLRNKQLCESCGK